MSRGLSGFGWCVAATLVLTSLALALGSDRGSAPPAAQKLAEAQPRSGPRDAAAKPSAARPRPNAEADRCSTGLTVDWDFRTASPISAPGVLTADGQLYLTTHEGYLHAVSREGDFLWSYTVDGALLWGSGVDSRGRVHTLSSKGIFYLFDASGNARWVYRFRSPSSAVAFTENGVTWVPHGHNLYTLAPGAGVRWRAYLGSEVNSGPWVREDGSAWITTRDGRLRRVSQSGRPSAVLDVGSQARVVGVTAQGAALVLADSLLRAIDDAGEQLWQYAGVRAAAPDAGLVVSEERLLWLDEQGHAQAEVALKETLSAAPARAGDWAWVPTLQGELLAVHREGSIERCRISGAPLMLPLIDAARTRVLATAGDGSVSAVRHRDVR